MDKKITNIKKFLTFFLYKLFHRKDYAAYSRRVENEQLVYQEKNQIVKYKKNPF